MIFAPGIFTVLFVLAVFPVALAIAAMQDYQAVANRCRIFFSRHTPREQELTKTSWGVALLAIVALALYGAGAGDINRFLGALRAAPENPLYFAPALAVAGVMLWAILWTVTGARRALWFGSFRDGRIITRALVKIAAGAAVYAVMWNPPAEWSPVVLALIAAARASPYARFAVEALVIWLTVTGLVKLVLVVWRRFSRARDDVATDIAAREFNWRDFQ